jgi:amino acid permease
MAEIWSSWEKYVSSILNSLTGVETFVDASGRIINPSPYVKPVTASAALYSLICILLAFGAAYLSFCYNKHIGNDSSEQILWPIVCYLFFPIYHIYYSLVINPLSNKKKD